jgi:ergothioneine biosynthesis protein EgtB
VTKHTAVEKRRLPSFAGASRYAGTRRRTLSLAEPLTAEDQAVQAMDDASPTKWHLAHTTWFFETFVLKPQANYRSFDERFAYCFNSYYEAVGPRHARPKRGLLTRPSLEEVHDYRRHVDEAIERLLASGLSQHEAELIELGLNHEEQHQELILTDILALFAANPLRPAYRPVRERRTHGAPQSQQWVAFEGGVYCVGHPGRGFAFDNERPHHEVLLPPFRLANRLVTNSEWLEFMGDGGYATPTLWLSDGWTAVTANGWSAPGYWERKDGQWRQMSLEGLLPVEPAAPVCHISYFEADAFARWAGKRLPTEFEWEVGAQEVLPEVLPDRTAASSGALRPLPVQDQAPSHRLVQMFGEVWQWTQSAYAPYPGFRPAAGALGEYNGKFMCGQYVLRGASCATPLGHSRKSYRNFFYPHQRWQFSGLRLAEDAR